MPPCHARPCGIFVGRLQWDQVFFQYFGFTLSISFHQCSIFIHRVHYVTLTVNSIIIQHT